MSDIFLTDTDRADVDQAQFILDTIRGVDEVAESFFNKDGTLDADGLDFTHVKEIRAALATLVDAITWLHKVPHTANDSVSGLLERNGIRASVMQGALRGYITAAHQYR